MVTGCLILAIIAAPPASPQGVDDYPRSEFVWPVSSSAAVDSPQTSPFGPRLHANAGFIYDFHRGLDIEAPLGTPIYAIHDATVNAAGVITGLINPGVQLRIEAPGRPTLYPTYLHMSQVAVEVGDEVLRGELLGYSGASSSGFAHLHLEIRRDGLLQRHAVNPLQYLPIDDTADHQVNLTISAPPSDPDDPRRTVVVGVRAPFEELDIEGVSLVLRAGPNLAAAPVADLSEWQFNLGTLNREQTPFVDGVSDITILDDPLVTLDPNGMSQVLIAPARFDGKNPPAERAAYEFTFLDVPIGGLDLDRYFIGAIVRDVAGNTASDWLQLPVGPLPTTQCDGRDVTVFVALGGEPTDGDDVILGTDRDDLIAAGAGDDVVCGQGGGDVVWGQGGNDILFGGDGDDRLRGGDGNDRLLAGNGNDDLAGGRGDDEVLGEAGDDSAVRGGTGDDTVDGGPGNDPLVAGNGGSDVVFGGADNDKVTGGPRPDQVAGGDGDDEVKGNKGADIVLGGRGDDALFGGPQPDNLDGGDGVDTCNAGITGAPAVEADTAVNCETATNIP